MRIIDTIPVLEEDTRGRRGCGITARRSMAASGC